MRLPASRPPPGAPPGPCTSWSTAMSADRTRSETASGRQRLRAPRYPRGMGTRLSWLWPCAALYAASIAVLLASHMGHGWGFVDLHVYERSGAAVRAGEHRRSAPRRRAALAL